MSSVVFLDTESYSDVDIKTAGSARRTDDPSTDILSVSWAIDDAPVSVWSWGDSPQLLQPLHDAFAAGATLAAHNAEHDWRELRDLLGIDIPLHQVIDTAGWCGLYNRPRSLGRACQSFRIPSKFDSGPVQRFWKPNPHTGDRILPIDDPESWRQALRYNAQDVEALRHLYHVFAREKAMLSEIGVWKATAAANDRGVAFDWCAVRGGLALIERETKRLVAACRETTGGIAPTQRDALLRWINGRLPPRARITNLQAQTIRDQRAAHNLPDDVQQVLTWREQTSHSGPLGKISAAARMRCSDHRVHGQLMYCGTVTGRWASRGLQFQNMPRPGLSGANMDRFWRRVASRDLRGLREMVGDDVLGAMAANIRGIVVPAEGSVLGVCDLAKIEACVVDWFGGELTAMHALATGERDLYKETAAAMYKITVSDVTQAQRHLGKMVVLGSGYGLGARALRRNLAGQGMTITEDLAQTAIRTYRQMHRGVVQLWRRLLEGSVQTVAQGTTNEIGCGAYFYTDREDRSGSREPELRMYLPSGRSIYYPGARILTLDDGVSRIVEYDQPGGGRKALTHSVLVENLASGTARDLMAHALVQADRDGLGCSLTVHDELVCEGPAGISGEMHRIMTTPPEWAADRGLLVGAEGADMMRYGK